MNKETVENTHELQWQLDVLKFEYEQKEVEIKKNILLKSNVMAMVNFILIMKLLQH